MRWKCNKKWYHKWLLLLSTSLSHKTCMLCRAGEEEEEKKVENIMKSLMLKSYSSPQHRQNEIYFPRRLFFDESQTLTTCWKTKWFFVGCEKSYYCSLRFLQCWKVHWICDTCGWIFKNAVDSQFEIEFWCLDVVHEVKQSLICKMNWNYCDTFSIIAQYLKGRILWWNKVLLENFK